MAPRFTHILQFSTTAEQSDAFDRLADALPLHSKSDILRWMLDSFLREQGAVAPARTNGAAISGKHQDMAEQGR